jgi:uncharacterized protein YbjT (DUF2867 family)
LAPAATAAPPALPTAIIAGANGLTGSALVRLMLRTGDYGRVLALTRRPLPIEHPRLANRILNYEELAASLVGVTCTDAFCCLGAARGPRADVTQLQRVDLELTLAFARAARAAGATRLLVISAAGAARGSSSAFQRIKGQMEADLKELKFPALDILQPGVVLGERAGGSALDGLRQVLAPLVNLVLVGALENSRWISAADLAAAMLGAARGQRRGVAAYGGKRLEQLTSVGARRT